MSTLAGNPVNHFPIYEPSAERVAAITQAHSEANNPLAVHYDASAEVRAKGAGFYQFSGDEETRRQQMEELKFAREETERTRKDVGAVDLRPGELEGMQDNGESNVVGLNKSRAMEKRKRELEERRRIVDAKRRKVKGGADDSIPGAEMGEKTFEASVPILPTVAAAPSDTFVALEAQAHPVNKRRKEKGKAKADPKAAADDFLARLEQDILEGKGK